MNQNYFETIKRLQEQISKISVPYQQFYQQLEILNYNLRPFYRELALTQQRLYPMLEPFLKQQELIQSSMLKIAKSMNALNANYYESLSKLAQIQIPTIRIPEIVYPQLEELESAVNDALQEEYIGFQLDTQFDDVQISKDKLTWRDILTYVMFVLQLIIQINSDHQNNIQEDLRHQEIMNELKNQTVIQEKHLEFEKESALRLEEQFKSFLKFIDPYVPVDQVDPESDSESD